MIQFDIPDNIKAKQCRELLHALTLGPIDTISAREKLGISHPAGRVRDLRKAGLPIKTRKAWAVDAEGRRHLVGVYLLGGASHAE